MPVPKAAPDLHDSPVTRQHDVRAARETHQVEAEAIAEAVKRAAHGELGLGVLAANAGHHLGALGLGESVSHG